MFDIILYTSVSESDVVNKTLTDAQTLTGTLKDETSLIDPVITVNVSIGDIRNKNYVYIPPFNRYYFIRDMKSIRKGIVELTCHVDVLQSFASTILNCKCIVAKTQQSGELGYNLYLNDGGMKIYQDPVVTYHFFERGFSSYHYILGVAGG